MEDRANLDQGEELFRQLAENAREVLFIAIPDPLRIAYVNPAYETLSGKSRLELYERADACIDSVHPEDRQHVVNIFERSMQGFPASAEYRLIRSDGAVRWIHSRSVPARDSAGRLSHILGIAEDITDRKRALEVIEVAGAAAEASHRAKTEFLANMNHEIRTPLSGIMGMTDLLLNTSLTPEQVQYLQVLRISAESLLMIVNDILDFSSIVADKTQLLSIPFDLHEILGEEMKTFQAEAHRKGLGFTFDVHPDVPDLAVGDPARLRQILGYLLENALKFTDRGKVAVTVWKETGTGRDALLHFSVRDTGIGIPREKQEMIFDAFFQADSSYARKFGGTGLRLTFARQLVELMGGRMWVQSEAGHGSTFHFTVRLGTRP